MTRMNTIFASLPIPEARELERLPSEFAGLLQLDCSSVRARSDTGNHRRAAHSQSSQESVQISHIDDPRASIYALFA
jgi:hypothetical protein